MLPQIAGIKQWLHCRPAVTAAAGLTAGILAADSGIATPYVLSASAALVIIVLFFGACIQRLFAVGLLIGVVTYTVHTPEKLGSAYFYSAREYKGIVENVRRHQESQSCIVAIADSTHSHFLCRLTVMAADPPLNSGDAVSFVAELRPPLQNAGIPLPGSYTSDKSARISARASVPPSDIEISGHSDAWKYRPAALARRLRALIMRSDLTPEAATLLSASLLGSQSGMPLSGESFRAAGLAHLFCVSGFHVGLAATLLAIILWPLRLWEWGYRYRWLLIIPGIWLFVLATGFTAPGVRAAIMLTIVMTAKTLERDVIPINSLAAALLIILALNPHTLFSPSLQLSVSAVAGLIIIAPALNFISPKKRIAWHTANIFIVPAAAMLGTLPVLIHIFHSVPLLSVPVNAIIAPLFPVFIFAGTVSALLTSIGIGFMPLTASANGLAHLFDSVTGGISALPFSTITGLYPSGFSLMLIVITVSAITAALRIKNTDRRIASATIASFSFLLVSLLPMNQPKAEVVFNGEDMIVNTGDSAALYSLRASGIPQHNYADYLQARGIHPQKFTVNTAGVDSIISGTFRIIILRKDTELPTKNNQHILIYLHRTNRHTAEEIATLEPELILLSSTIPFQRRLDMINEYRRKGIAVHDLALTPAIIRQP